MRRLAALLFGLIVMSGALQADSYKIVPSFGTTTNYGIWYDRTQWTRTRQRTGAQLTAVPTIRGIYDVVIKYHAMDADTR